MFELVIVYFECSHVLNVDHVSIGLLFDNPNNNFQHYLKFGVVICVVIKLCLQLILWFSTLLVISHPNVIQTDRSAEYNIAFTFHNDAVIIKFILQ